SARGMTMVDVFISYKRQERAKAQAIADAIAQRGHDVWWDGKLLPSRSFAEEIKVVIQRARAALVLWSEEAVRSNFVRAEASLAQERGILIAVRLDNCKLPAPFGDHQAIDLRQWTGASHDLSLQPLISIVESRMSWSEAASVIEKRVQLTLGTVPGRSQNASPFAR